jgi:hypothetical protein
MRKKKTSSSIKSDITSPIKGTESRKTRDRKTFVTSPIKPKDTFAKQWNRYAP